MRTASLLLVACMSTFAAAQTQFQIYPGDSPNNCTTFTSRITLNTNPGEYCQEYPAGFFSGIGETSPNNCQVTAIQVVSQDQNAVTQENYRFLLRSEATGGGPDATAAGVICATSVFQLPPGVGVAAWRITITFGTPCTVPCDQSWFVCHELIDPRPVTTDGHTQHFAHYTSNTTGEVARATAGNHCWAIVKDTSGNVLSVSQPSVRVPRFSVFTGCPSLGVGNRHADARCSQDPAFGVGGMYPDNQGRGDGIALRVKDSDGVAAGQQVLVFMSFSSFPTGFALPGILDCASIRIGPSPFIQIAFGSNTIGDASSPLADETYVTPAFLAPGTLTTATGAVWFQAVVGRTSLPFPMTNAAATLLGS